MNEQPTLHGVMAEFDSAEALLHAAQAAHDAGYRRMDAYSPFPIEGLAHALGMHSTRLPWLVLLGGITGALTGYLLQVYTNTWDYPYLVGGRPLHSWPAFIPVTFELCILFASLTAVLGMLMLNGLPRPYHPAFNVPRFALASRDRFFLCIEASDPRFDCDAVTRFLEAQRAQHITQVAD